MLGCVHVCQGGQRYLRAGLCVCVCIVQQVKRELDARPVQVAAGAPSEAIKVDGFVHAAMATTATATGLLPFNEMRLLSAKVASATHRPPPAVRAMACLRVMCVMCTTCASQLAPDGLSSVTRDVQPTKDQLKPQTIERLPGLSSPPSPGPSRASGGLR